MCTGLIQMPNGAKVPCRVCGQCRENLVNDWLGRCRAEMETSAHTFFVTLTYGNDDKYGSVEDNLDAKKLNYQHVKHYLMLLRKWTRLNAVGRPVVYEKTRLRYFAVGEYGSEKGRAHWHLLIFCEGRIPPNVAISWPGMDERFMHTHQGGGLLWPHGFSHWRVATIGSARYLIKYITKTDIRAGQEKRMGLSIKPPLGDAFFRIRAAELVLAGLSPQNCWYEFPDCVYLSGPRKGQARQFFLGGSAIYNFLNYYAVAWRVHHGNENWPSSLLMDEFVEERYKRDQRGQWDWRDEPDWAELKRLERRGQWRKSPEGGLIVPTPYGSPAPFPPVSAYETASSGE